MIRYLIIDDEHIAHDVIKRYCDMLPNMDFQRSCYDALEAIEYLSGHSVDLIFLDLNMPKIKGFDFLKTLSTPPKVIVTTAYQEHALEGYELNVVDYLLKPFSFERFLTAINKVVAEPNIYHRSVKSGRGEHAAKNIFLKSDKKYVQIFLDDLQYIEASGNYTKLITTDDIIEIRQKISDVYSLLSDMDLIQVHKSFAVSKKHINSIESNRIYIADQIIPIGKTYKMNVTKLLR